jgi:hypothetical protein
MSTAIRHAMAWNKDEEGCIYVFPVQQADGNWIKWEDYAKLKAEVERLTAFTTRTIIPNELLNAEVERLKNNCDYLDTKLDEELDKSAMLSGQVERLTDAITRGASTPDAHPHA